MADDKKTIEISFAEDERAKGLTSQSSSDSSAAQAQAARDKEEQEFRRLREQWARQEQEDRKQLEDFFVESTRRGWEKTDEDDLKRRTSLDSFDDLMTRMTQRAEKDFAQDQSFLHSIGRGTGDPDGSDLLGGSNDPDSLRGQIDALTEELDALADGTRQSSGGLRGFVAGIGTTIASLVGGGGGGAGGAGLGLAGGAGGAAGAGGLGLAGAAGLAAGGLLAIVGAALAFDRVVNSLVEQVGGFSGEVVQASVRSRLQEIEDRMRLAREAGGTIADLERTRSDTMSELRGIVREGVELFGPLLNGLAKVFLELPLSAVRGTLELTNDAIDLLVGNSELQNELLAQGNDARSKMLNEARKARREREKFLPNFGLVEDFFASNFLERESLMQRRGQANRGKNQPPFI